MTPSEMLNEVVGLLDKMQNNFSELSGEIFSTGTNSLQPGDIYIAGLNPGSGSKYPTIRKHVTHWLFDEYSAFIDQCWKKDCWDNDCYAKQENIQCNFDKEDCRRGKERHQVAVQKIVERALHGQNIRQVFATNAIFARSKSANSFKKENGISLAKAFDECWPVHQFFLFRVKPKVILSLGYSEDASAYSFFKKKAESRSKTSYHSIDGRKYPSFKWTEIKIGSETSPLTVLLVGIRHPSWVPNATKPKEFKELIDGYIKSRAIPENTKSTNKAA